MPITVKALSITSLLLIATALSSWSIILSTFHPKAVLPIDPFEIDAYMEDVVMTLLDNTGQPSLMLATPKMTHFPDQDTTYILQPHLTLIRQSTQPWYIDAKEARAIHGINEVLFWNEVNIQHNADKEHPRMSMATDYLTIFPDQQLASTNKAVTFTQPDLTIHAIGMQANLNDGTIKLLSEAKGEYAAKP